MGAAAGRNLLSRDSSPVVSSLQKLPPNAPTSKERRRGFRGSNPPLSANQSVRFTYILEEAETPRAMWRSFRPQRTGESRLTPDSPDSASILSARSKNGSLRRLNALWAAFAPPSPFQETDSLISIDRI